MSLKKQVEAVLFTTGRFMSEEEIAEHLTTKSEEIKKVLEELQKRQSKKK